MKSVFDDEAETTSHFGWLFEFMQGRGIDWDAWRKWAYAHPGGFILEPDGVFLTWASVAPKLRAWLARQGYDVPTVMTQLEQWEPEPAPDDSALDNSAADFDPFED